MHLGRALSLYTNHFLSVFLIGILIGFPLQMITYIYSSFNLFGLHISSFIISIMIQLFLLNIMQIPFIQLADQVQNDQKIDFKEIFGQFVMSLVPVSIMNVYILICVLIGIPLLIFPGLFMLVLFYLFPYTQIIEGKRGWELFKKTYYIGRSGFVDLMFIGLIFVCLNIILWTLTSQGLLWFDDNMSFGVFLLFRMVLTCLIIPIIVFVVTINYYDWKKDSGQVESGQQHERIKLRS